MSDIKPKKKTRRSVKYPALDPHLNLKTRFEEIEDLASYANTLNDADKAWLNAFAEEEICANFEHSGIKLNDSSQASVRKRIYDRNNQRNRCIFSREKAQNTMNYLEDLDIDNSEDAEIEDGYDTL